MHNTMIAIRSTASKSSFSLKRKLTSSNRRFKSTAPVQQQSPPTATSGENSSSSSFPFGASLLAAFAGVGVVAASAQAVESATGDSCLPYSSETNAQRYDQSTFGGRFARMLLACDPSLLLCGEHAVRDARQRLLEFEDQKSLPPSAVACQSRMLWESKRIVESALHPDTGQVIPRPFRMSGYVPFNGPICVSMVASTSTGSLLFWSWVNQSQNALVNYYNRNASAPMSNETLLQSYSAAVGSALLVAFGLSSMVQKKYSPAKAKQMMKYVAFPSAVVASSLNCYVVRSPEITTGIPLQDNHGNPLVLPPGDTNSSRVAGRRGVESTTLSRAILQAPVYFFPSVLMGVVPPLRRLVEHHPRTRIPLTTFLVLVSFGLGLPATIAIFPQISELKASEAEPKYRALIDPETNQPYEVFRYNKGL